MKMIITIAVLLTSVFFTPLHAEESGDDCDCGPEPIRQPADPNPFPEPER